MNTGRARRETRGGVEHLVLTRTFDLPAAELWRLLTDPDELSRWFGTWRGDPASGEVEVRMVFEGDEAPWEAHAIDACEEPHHLGVRSLGEDPWILDLRLSESAGVTTLDFAQRSTPGDMADIAAGWDYYLDRLVAVAAGGEAAEVTWAPYEQLIEEYRTVLGAG
ncbi:SRPBCC domain-containing protein [Propioniciclava sp.]|uniref:SRPBCC domain-containing protein n=1 Tax=Propioniciclava sp. TaxID=2038686 RepID=UPI0026383695|nr:SRPBCC domain-containing protein [Propioniciclava sp.]